LFSFVSGLLPGLVAVLVPAALAAMRSLPLQAALAEMAAAASPEMKVRRLGLASYVESVLRSFIASLLG
jgi:hypothetical protein